MGKPRKYCHLPRADVNRAFRETVRQVAMNHRGGTASEWWGKLSEALATRIAGLPRRNCGGA